VKCYMRAFVVKIVNSQSHCGQAFRSNALWKQNLRHKIRVLPLFTLSDGSFFLTDFVSCRTFITGTSHKSLTFFY
jgi:hypothetical protein